jgi:hypothetical protein
MKIEKYINFGGGLGDVFVALSKRGVYDRMTQELSENSDCTFHVNLMSICNGVDEFFNLHPLSKQIKVHEHFQVLRGCVFNEIPLYYIKKYSIHHNNDHIHPIKHGLTCFVPNAETEIFQSICAKPFIIFSTQSDANRTIPSEIVSKLVDDLSSRFNTVKVGRSNFRFSNDSVECVVENDKMINLVDKISLPTLVELVRRASGIICCESALMNLGAVLGKKMQILISRNLKKYREIPLSYWFRCFEYPQVNVTYFDDFSPSVVNKFNNILDSQIECVNLHEYKRHNNRFFSK